MGAKPRVLAPLVLLLVTVAGLTTAGCGVATRQPAALDRQELDTARSATARPEPSFDPLSISFVSPTTGWAFGPSNTHPRWVRSRPVAGVLAETTDGGARWRRVRTPRTEWPGPGSAAIAGVDFVNDSDGYLYGRRILYTDNGGHSWSNHGAPGYLTNMVQAGGISYAVSSCLKVTASCHDGVYRVNEHGQTFTRIGSARVPVGQLVPTSSGRLYELGGIPRDPKLWTFTPGARWRVQPSPCRIHGYTAGSALATLPSTGLLLACGYGLGTYGQTKYFYRSTDAGRHWTLVSRSPRRADGGVVGAGFVSGLVAITSKLWVMSLYTGGLDTTRDAGQRWRDNLPRKAQEPGTPGFDQLFYLGGRDVLALPSFASPSLAISSNDGRSWHQISFR